MSKQYNIISLMGRFQDITFIITRCIRMKILKKTARSGVSNSQGTQSTETDS